jgi:hypothetical protein
MKKARKYSKYILWFFACLILITDKGCSDNQNNKVIYVEGFSVVLYYHPSENPAALDIWNVSGDEEGKDITRIGHGFVLQLTDEEGEPYTTAGIRVDVEVVGHGSVAGYGDIWKKKAPGGALYGFLICHPEEGSGMSDGVFYGRTNGQGRLLICGGLGDPYGAFTSDDPLDYDYELPGPGGSYSDVFDTWAEFKITVPRKHASMQAAYVWPTFVRAQYQNMWAPLGGVYGSSHSGLGHWGGVGIQSGSFESETFEIPKIKKTVKDSKEKYPLIGSANMAVTTETLAESEPSLKSLVLTQLRWDFDYGWNYYYIQPEEKLHAIWTDTNDANDIKDCLSFCEPYAYWADITLPEPFYEDSATATVILRTLDNSNNIKSRIPLIMNLYNKSPDSKTLTFVSGWFVISEDPSFYNHYQDGWGNLYAAIYTPEADHLDISFPDSKDFACLAADWLKHGKYKSDISGVAGVPDGFVDYYDLRELVQGWLESQ